MALPRQSTFLPTIKCSVCGNQVEISMMGDHVCSSPSTELSPPPEEPRAPEIQLYKSPYAQYRRTPPPREEETSVADREEGLGGSQGHSRSRNTSENNLEAPKVATLPTNRPGGYGGFGDPTSNTRDKQRTGANFMDRINNTIPGPFDPNRRPFAAINAYPQRKESLDLWTPPPSVERSPPRLPRKQGYEGFGAPSNFRNGHQAGLVRSETYPNAFSSAQSSQMQRGPSVSEPQSDGSRHSGRFGHEMKRSMGLDTSTRPPPRTGLFFDHDSRNIRSVDLAAEFGIKNPYHASMSSVSSGYSDSSVTSLVTVQTSPTVEDTSSNGNRMKTSESGMETVTSSSRRFSPQVLETPIGTSPADLRFDRVSPRPGSGQHNTPAPYRGDYSLSRTRDGGIGSISEGRRFKTSDEQIDLPWSKRQETWEVRQGTRGHVSQPSRGDCKGCGIAITGKSISSADGRLTGKYHKACFVCSTCCEPFPSSDFYVLGDKPYCAQDYHRLNNSLCGRCGRGIEGQFAEDEARVKYHLSCFRCLDCGLSLADGYFEVGGYAYCERDAWKRVQAQSYAEQDAYRPVPSRGTPGARTIPNGSSARPSPQYGQSGRGYPPPPPPSHANSKSGRLIPGGADQRLRMNKRMTRLGNMNL
ncbi:hypothetical protein E4U55_005561 [Claviceps digitariae]|nr:hypothetical protein E4U55_005561 [Claviceps digitariae]